MQKSATVALIQSNRLLLLRRGESAPWMPGRYCLPGGRLDSNESLIDCAVREMFEETGLKLHTNELIPVTISYTSYSKIVYVCNSVGLYDVKLNWEHSEYHWATMEQSLSMSLVNGLATTIKTLGGRGLLI